MYCSSFSAENTLMASSAIRSGYNHRRFTRDGGGGMLSKIRGGRDFSTISAYSCSEIRVINGYYKVWWVHVLQSYVKCILVYENLYIYTYLCKKIARVQSGLLRISSVFTTCKPNRLIIFLVSWEKCIKSITWKVLHNCPEFFWPQLDIIFDKKWSM